MALAVGVSQAGGTECHPEHKAVKIFERSLLEIMFSLAWAGHLIQYFESGSGHVLVHGHLYACCGLELKEKKKREKDKNSCKIL